jgi:hypothetical protein
VAIGAAEHNGLSSEVDRLYVRFGTHTAALGGERGIV